ncbi:hypothetical protein DH2020_007473 [Rehmannia glutinosa]|uniref:Thaumatin-like protein n=1 Tax=Rehmannia glutinosa TaxID=99300 RepID=A0ABR0TY94_REHGL
MVCSSAAEVQNDLKVINDCLDGTQAKFQDEPVVEDRLEILPGSTKYWIPEVEQEKIPRADMHLRTLEARIQFYKDYVWPGILSNAGSSGLDTTGFQLQPRATRSFQAQPGWSGRFWGRTGCSFDPSTGVGRCATGDCGSNQIECNGAGAAPPATLAEFTIGSGAPDFYDVSLVDGYNLPMIVQPVGGSGACGLTGCVTDLNRKCPNELRAGDGQGCKSACEAFGNPEYCCSGAYGSPDTCRPSVYSEMFKNACPRSYSYAYDDATSIFTCSGADYTITFCPSVTR